MPLTRDADVIGHETHVVVQRAEVRAERRRKAKMAKMASKAIAELPMVKKNHVNVDSVEEAVREVSDHVVDMEAEAEIIVADCQNVTEQHRKAMEQQENLKANALEDHEMVVHHVAVDSVVSDRKYFDEFN
jgi:predicted amino acid racemase